MKDWARKKCPTFVGQGVLPNGQGPVTAETENFIDFFQSSNNANAVKRNWTQAWQVWMRREEKRLIERRGGRPARPDPTSDADRQYREAMARATAQEASEGQKLPAFHNQQTIMGELA
jgi:hypothetical protein